MDPVILIMGANFRTTVYTAPCTVEEVTDARVRAFLRRSTEPTCSVKNGWKGRLAKVVRNVFVYQDGLAHMVCFFRAAAKLVQEKTLLNLDTWTIETTGKQVIRAKDLAMLLVDELPASHRDAVRMVVKKMDHENLFDYYSYFTQSLDYIWALGDKSGRGGIRKDSEKPVRRDVCSYCKKGPHSESDCRKKKADQKKELALNPEKKFAPLKNRIEGRKCYNCGKVGHLSNACKEPPSRTRSGANWKPSKKLNMIAAEDEVFGQGICTIDGTEVPCIVDTGAATDAMSTAAENLLPREVRNRMVPADYVLKGVTGGEVGVDRKLPGATVVFPNDTRHVTDVHVFEGDSPLLLVSTKSGRELGLPMPQDDLFGEPDRDFYDRRLDECGEDLDPSDPEPPDDPRYHKLAHFCKPTSDFVSAAAGINGQSERPEEKLKGTMATEDPADSAEETALLRRLCAPVPRLTNKSVLTKEKKRRKRKRTVCENEDGVIRGVGHLMRGKPKIRAAIAKVLPAAGEVDGDEEQKEPPPGAKETCEINQLLKQDREEYLQELASGVHLRFMDRECLPREGTETCTLLGENFVEELQAQWQRLADAGLSEIKIRQILQEVAKFPEVFDGKLEQGSGLDPYHVVLKKDAGRPPQAKSRPLNAEKLDWLRGALDKLEKQNVISKIPGGEPGSSLPMHVEEAREVVKQEPDGNSYSALVLPEKKVADAIARVGTLFRQFRMCIDLVVENLRQEKAPYITPTVEDLRELAAGSKHFFVLDLLKGYFQIHLAEDSKKHFCFTCPLGKYQLNRLPMGGLNSSAHLQSCMDDLLGDITGVACYQDDVMGASSTWEDHLIKLRKVLTAF
ncbi:hypothetical protein HOF92_04315, partial [bacterium]|nr:hypothetical protein [bacterium]